MSVVCSPQECLGYWAGQQDGPVPAFVERVRHGVARLLPAAQAPARSKPASGPVVYYWDPDGKPVYSASPMVTADGREFRAVRASEDVRFDDGDGETMPADMASS